MGHGRRHVRMRRRNVPASASKAQSKLAGKDKLSACAACACEATIWTQRTTVKNKRDEKCTQPVKATEKGTGEPAPRAGHSGSGNKKSVITTVPRNNAANKGKCAVCGVESSSFCVLCCKVFYCNKAHQRLDWEKHKTNCFPCEFISDEELKTSTLTFKKGLLGNGPFMKATRDIIPTEIIFEERTLMTGPGIVADFPYEGVCLGCCRPTIRKCSQCKWPVCGLSCEKGTLHEKFECKIFKTRPVYELFDPFQYDLVRVLRCLLLREKDLEKFSRLINLEAALDNRKTMPALTEATNTACLFINELCGLKQFDKDTINKICGVVDLQTQVSGDYRTAMQLYTFPSKLLHSCKGNVRLCEGARPNGQHTLRVMAIKPIRSGEPLSYSPIMFVQPTHERQRFLLNNYYFHCKCKTCVDPTESGTFFSAVTCSVCTKQIKVEEMNALDLQMGNRYLLPEKPTEITSVWRCKTCRISKKACEIYKMYSESDNLFINVRSEISVMPSDEKIDLLRSKIKKLAEKFHPGNIQVFRARQILLSVLSQKMQSMDSPKAWPQFEELYQETQTLSASVISSVQGLQPGLTPSRGRCLYDAISCRWAYIQWCVIFRKADCFMAHPAATDFLDMVAEVLAIFRNEAGGSIKYIIEDVNYMKNNLDVLRYRLRKWAVNCLNLHSLSLVEGENKENECRQTKMK